MCQGPPLPGVRLRIVDAATGEVLGAGQPGLIEVTGYLMRGYGGASASHNEAAFTRDGWFRSGDLATVDGQGLYTIVGRSKELIISGGENIHPAEIENLALEDAAVAEAAVVGVPDPRWGEVAQLAIVLRPGRPYDAGRLQALFDARLARFKHPRRVVVLDALPKTALGKVKKESVATSLRG